MTVKRLVPYIIGDVARIGAPVRADDVVCWITAPDGQRFAISGRRGWAEVWLLQQGTWRYEWSTGDHGTLDVVVLEMPRIEADFVTVPDVDVKVSQTVLVEILCNTTHGGARVADRLRVGDTVSIRLKFRHPETKRLVEPSSVSVVLHSPTGDSYDIPLSAPGDGSFACGHRVDAEGLWKLVIESTGDYPRRVEDTFEVDPSLV